MKKYTAATFISDGTWDVFEDERFLLALTTKYQATMLADKLNEKEQQIAQLESDKLVLQNQLTEVTRDRDEWRESCKMANRRFETNDHAEKENFYLRKMLQNVLGLRNWIEFQLLRGDIEKLLKKEESNG
jgi:hypothetical protein